MLLTCTNKNYKSQSLVVPILGTITLDENCSFECPDDKADDFIKHSSLPFVKQTYITESGLVLTDAAPYKEGTKLTLSPVSLSDLEATLIKRFETLSEKEVNDFFNSVTEKILDKIKTLEQAQEKAKQETEETVVNKEELIEAINEANIDELKSLIPLVPKVKKKDVKNLNEDELRKFLIEKVNEAKSN